MSHTGTSGSTEVVIPWRTDHAQRQALRDYLEPTWHSAAGCTVTYAPDPMPAPAPFSVARACNTAIGRSRAEVIVLYGADQLPHLTAVREAIARVHAGAPWSPLFRAVSYADEASTASLLAGRIAPWALRLTETHPLAPGVLAVHRDVWADVRGFDPAFTGWGWEDCALLDALNTLHPIDAALPAHGLVELWHPPTRRDRTAANPNHARYHRLYAAAAGDPAAMRHLVTSRAETADG